MHVDLLNEADSIVAHRKLFINEVNEAGDIEISKDWKPGNYTLRAYTNFMRNYSPEYFFTKSILIWNPDKKDTEVENSETELQIQEFVRPELNFYPEGGNLIAGIKNRIAVKLNIDKIDDQEIVGLIYDNEGNKVSEFKVYEFGLGQFNIIPEVGKTYYASLNYNGGEEHYPLPKALTSGMSIEVLNQGANVVIQALSNTDGGLQGSFILAHQRGQVLFQNYQSEAVSDYSIRLDAAELNDGVVHLTLFDKNGMPVAERLFFVDTEENEVAVSIKRAKSVLSQRDQSSISLSASNAEGNEVSGYFSLSIRDAKLEADKSSANNLKTWLLLNSDLRGTVENPMYFFEAGEENKKRFLLDLVMLTNGWRRFAWNDLLAKENKQNDFDVERGIFISGKVQTLKSRSEPLSVPTRITFVNKEPYQEVQKTDEAGNFSFGPFVFFGPMSTLIEARKSDLSSDKSRDRKVLITVNHREDLPKFHSDKLNTSQKIDMKALMNVTNYMEQIRFEYGENVKELDEVVVKAKAKSERDKRMDEMDARTMYGSPTDRVIADEEAGSEWRTVLEVLRAKPGIQTTGTGIALRGGQTPAFYLDGMEIDSTYIGQIYASDVEFIDILKGPDASIFSNSGNGVVAIYSKVGTDIAVGSVRRKPGIIDFPSQGFYVAREFYAPNHLNGFEDQTKKDIRTTLHWVPEIKLAPEKPYKLSFFTGDLKGEYLIEVEGITSTGVPVYSTSTILVE